MGIEFACGCGKNLKAKDEAAGKRTKCPFCGALVNIPERQRKVAIPTPQPDAVAAAREEALPLDISESSVKIEPLSATSYDAIPSVAAVAAESSELPSDGQTREYKVLTPKDMGFHAKFDAAKLEETLNSWSKKGWTLRSAFVQVHTSHSGTHHDTVVIMER